MLSIFALPRQFQIAVVENVDEHHLRKATWLFPLYLLLINVFVLPIALGGLMLFGRFHLPGDLTFRSGGVTIYVPIATSIILSIVLTVILNVIFRQR